METLYPDPTSSIFEIVLGRVSNRVEMMSRAVRSKEEERGWMSMIHGFRESLNCRNGTEGRFMTLFRPYLLIFEAILEIVIDEDVCSFEGRRAQLSSDTDAKQINTLQGSARVEICFSSPVWAALSIHVLYLSSCSPLVAVRDDSLIMTPERPHPPLSMLC
jgi:hypothetical protein